MITDNELCQEGSRQKQTSNPDFIFSIKDSMFASCCELLGGAFIFTGTWSRPTERKLAEFRLFAMETWCLGDDGGLSSVSLGLLRSAISSSRAALLVAIKSPNLKTTRHINISVRVSCNFQQVIAVHWPFLLRLKRQYKAVMSPQTLACHWFKNWYRGSWIRHLRNKVSEILFKEQATAKFEFLSSYIVPKI